MQPPSDYCGPRDWSEQDALANEIVKNPGKMSQLDPAWGLPQVIRPKSIIIGLSALVMFLLLLIPSWNAVGLLQDTVFTYMAGSELTGWLLVCCILLFLTSYITLQIFLQRLRPELEAEAERTMLMISGIFLSTLGIMLILFGGPLTRQATVASTEFTSNCKSGKMTQPLFQAQAELQSLRATPSCAKLSSIEECIVFPAFPKMKEALVLKAMETNYQCSGMCSGSNANGEQIYPPTLFSKANYKVSCDGMASRRLINFNAGLSSQMVAEGCMLVGTAIVISLCQLIALCTSRGKRWDAVSGKSYGATL